MLLFDIATRKTKSFNTHFLFFFGWKKWLHISVANADLGLRGKLTGVEIFALIVGKKVRLKEGIKLLTRCLKMLLIQTNFSFLPVSEEHFCGFV